MALLKRKSRVFRIICCLLAFLLVQNSLEHVQAQPTPFLPSGQNYFADLSVPYSLPVLRGMRVYSAKPFEFDFVVDSEDRHTLDKKETSLLIKYFLTCLTVPEEDLWVNLSPYESGRIIPDELALTDAGNTLLEQDKFLKQLASSLTYPESRLGKKFWEKVYKKTYEKFGTTNLPVNTYNKVWIVPDKAVVYDMGNSALIGETHLKVMLEADYLALKKHMAVVNKNENEAQQLSSNITKEIILPELEKEINEGKNFAPVRQIFHSMVLAAWFKRALKRNVLNDFYVNKKKISGIDGVDKNAKEKIYKQYLRIYKAGAYNYIREDVDPISQQVVPRKYFSGGFFGGDAAMWLKTLQVPDFKALIPSLDKAQMAGSSYGVAKVELSPIGGQKELDRLMEDSVNRSDRAQMAFSTILKKFVLTVALAVTLYAAMPGGSAQAAVITPNVDGKTLEVKIEKNDTLGAILLQAGYRGPLWGTNGTVAKVGEIIKDEVPDVERIYAGHKFNLPAPAVQPAPAASTPVPAVQPAAPVVQSVAQAPAVQSVSQAPATVSATPATSIVKPILKPIVKPAASVVKHTVLSAPAVQPAVKLAVKPAPIVKPAPTTLQSLPTPQSAPSAGSGAPPPPDKGKFFTVLQTVHRVPVIVNQVANTQGTITILHPYTMQYGNGQSNFTINDPQIDRDFQAITSELRTWEGVLKVKEAAFEKGAETGKAVSDARQKVQELQNKLAEVKIKKDREIVRAPENQKVIKWLVSSQSTVSPGKPILNYYNPGRFRINLAVDKRLKYSTHIADFKINGKKARYSILGWEDIPQDQSKAYLILLVTQPSSSSSTSGTGDVEVSARIYPAVDDFKILNSIVGYGGPALTRVGNEELDITVPQGIEASSATFFVDEGNFVKKGTLLVQLDSKPYQQQLKNVNQRISDIDKELKEAEPGEDGKPIVGLEEKAILKIEKDSLLVSRGFIQTKINLTRKTAPLDGVVSFSAAHGSKDFGSGDTLLKVIPTDITLGKIQKPGKSDGTFPVIFTMRGNQDKIERGDVFVVQDAQGNRLPAIAVAAGDSTNEAINKGNVNSIVIMVHDPKNVLRPNAAVKVIRVKPEEQSAVRCTLPGYLQKGIRKDRAMISRRSFLKILAVSVSAAVAGSPFLDLNNAFARTKIQEPSKYSLPQGQGQLLNLQDLEDKVLGNDLVAGNEAIQMIEKQAQEGLPGALELSLFGGVWNSNNGVTFAGGASGVWNSMGASLYGGSALNPVGLGLQLVFQIGGHFIDLLTGKIGKEKALAVTMTKIANYHWQTVRYQEVNRARQLLVDLGAAQQRIGQLKILLNELNSALEKVNIRVNMDGLSVIHEANELESKINKVKGQILILEGKVKDLTVDINGLMGKKINELDAPLLADLPWEKSFPGISKEKESRMREKLTGDTSQDPRMLEAKASLDAMEQTVKLQNLKKLPEVDLGDLYSTSALNNTVYNLPVALDQKNTTVVQRNNEGLVVKLPIIDQTRDIKTNVIALERKRAAENIRATQESLGEELAKTVGRINSSSDGIRQAQEAYQKSLNAWKDWVEDDYHHLRSGTKSVDLFIQMMDEKLGDIIAQETEYFKAVSDLRRMELLAKGEFPAQDQAMMGDQAQLSGASFFQKFVGIAAIVVALFTAAPYVVHGDDEIQDQVKLAQEWASIQGNGSPNSSEGINGLKDMLNADDIVVRQGAMKNLGQYQGNKDFIKTVQDIIMTSQYPDVAQEIFRFMVERKDHDLPFFVQMIHEAAAKNRTDVLALAFQSLEEVLTNNPNIFGTLSATDFPRNSLYPDVSPEAAEEVFLTLLANPNSIASQRLGLSNYFSSKDLAKKYNQLEAWVKDNPRDPRIVEIDNLAGLIYDLILRKEALKNIEPIFSKALYKYVPHWFPEDDDISKARLDKGKEETARFLKTSPRWREMKKYIRPDLYAKALKATENFIAMNKGASMSQFPLYSYSPNQNESSLNYFNALGPDGQQEYIDKTRSIYELALILKSPTLLRAAALDRLMATADGRLLARQIHLGSTDTGLLQLIENRDWMRTLKKDAREADNPYSIDILRRDDEKMFDRTKQGSFLDARLYTVPAPEMPFTNDLRGPDAIDAMLKFKAGEGAIEVLNAENESYGNVAPYPGWSTRTVEAEGILGDIDPELDKTLNPQEFESKLDEAFQKGDPKTKAEIKKFRGIRDKIYGFMKKNDQDVPMVLKGHKWIAGIIGAGALPGIGYLFYGWYRKKKADVPQLFEILEKELEVNKKYNGNGKNGEEAANALIPQDMYTPLQDISTPEKPLQNWQKLFNNWSPDTPVKDLLRDLNTILNNADEASRLMPFNFDLIRTERPIIAGYNKNLIDLFFLAGKTSDFLSDQLRNMKNQNTPQDKIDKLKLWQAKSIMLKHMSDVKRYLRNLQSRGNYNIVMGYKEPDDNWKERWRIFPVLRWALLYSRLWDKSEKRLFKKGELLEFLEEQNKSKPGFYKDPVAIVKQCEILLKDVTKNAKKFSDNELPHGTSGLRGRSFWGRVLLGSAAVALGLTAIGYSSHTPWLIFSSLTGFSLITTTYSIINFWIPHLYIIARPWDRTMRLIIEKLNNKLNDALDPEGEDYKKYGDLSSQQQRERLIEDLAKMEGEEAIRNELSAHTIKKIVIIAENPDDINDMNSFKEEQREGTSGKIVRDDVPIEVMSPEHKGSGYAYEEAFFKVRKKLGEEGRVIYILYDKDAPRPVKNTLIRSITDGYRGAASMSRSSPVSSKEDIILFARDVYEGPIEQVEGSDITFESSRVKRDDLPWLGLINSKFAYNGDPKIDQLLEKLNIPSLLKSQKPLGSKIAKTLRDRLYVLSNPILKQYSTFNGTILMGREGVDLFEKIIEKLRSTGLKEKLSQLHFTSDFVIPMLIAKSFKSGGELKKELDEYWQERIKWPDIMRLQRGQREETREALRQLYALIAKTVDPDIKISAFMPYPEAEIFQLRRPGNGTNGNSTIAPTSDVEPESKPERADQAVISSEIKKEGGIDLNFQPQFIQQASRTSPTSIQEAAITDMPDGFKGFNFNIVSFTSNLTVNGAFQLMFNPN